MNRTLLQWYYNGTMMFNVNITSQDITISSGFSNMFVLGGGVVSSQLDVSNEDVLVGMDYNIHAFWNLEFKNFEVLSFTNNMFIHDANGALTQNESSTWGDYEAIIDPYFFIRSNRAGSYQSHCSLTRDADQQVIATQTGPSFEILGSQLYRMEVFSATHRFRFLCSQPIAYSHCGHFRLVYWY